MESVLGLTHDWVGAHPAGLHLLRARRVQVALLLLARGHLATKKLQEVQHADEAAAEELGGLRRHDLVHLAARRRLAQATPLCYKLSTRGRWQCRRCALPHWAGWLG